MNRLFNKVKLDGDCWEWIACKSIGGYGRILINGKARMAHRISYELLINKIPTGLTLNHECRNKHGHSALSF